jgi:hypothetical protein
MSFVLKQALYDLIDLSDKQDDCKFGASLASYGAYIAVGAPNYVIDEYSDGNGAVFIFEQDNSGTFSYKTKLTSTSLLDGQNFGSSVSIYGDFIVIGAPGGELGGSVFLFQYNSSLDIETWEIVDEYKLEDGENNGNFGGSVSIYNNFVIVGYSYHNSNIGKAIILKITPQYYRALEPDFFQGGRQGQSLFYDWWEGPIQICNFNEITILSNPTTEKSLFGQSVAIYKEYAVISAPQESEIGVVYAYQYINNEWIQIQHISPSDGQDSDLFGSSLSMTNEYLVIGAINKTSEDAELLAGQVYLYNNQNDIWTLLNYNQLNLPDREASYYGSSLFIDKNYIFIGSPGANSDKGSIELLIKDYNWGYLSNISPIDTVNFGSLISVYENILAISAIDLKTSTNGDIYVYTNSSSKVKLAQSIVCDGSYVPSKVSVYFKRAGCNLGQVFEITPTEGVVIDATNFSELEQKTNKLIYDDTITGYTGNGYMTLAMPSSYGDEFGTFSFPVQSSEPKSYYVNLRYRSTSSSLKVDILFDNVIIKSINETTVTNSWLWISNIILIPDTKKHDLSIKIKENGVAIDKIYIDALQDNPIAEGPENSVSPYVTSHLRIFNASNYAPNEPICIYDYKSTINEIKQDDWYNFDTNVLDTNYGYSTAAEFNGIFYVVITSSGSNSKNYILWEIENTDEYTMDNFSAIKV